MRAILEVIQLVLQLYTWVIIFSAVFSWLLAFNMLNYNNNIVRSIWNALHALTEPLLAPIRRRMPNPGAIDLSPVVLLLAIILLDKFIAYNLIPLLGR